MAVLSEVGCNVTTPELPNTFPVPYHVDMFLGCVGALPATVTVEKLLEPA